MQDKWLRIPSQTQLMAVQQFQLVDPMLGEPDQHRTAVHSISKFRELFLADHCPPCARHGSGGSEVEWSGG